MFEFSCEISVCSFFLATWRLQLLITQYFNAICINEICCEIVINFMIVYCLQQWCSKKSVWIVKAFF